MNAARCLRWFATFALLGALAASVAHAAAPTDGDGQSIARGREAFAGGNFPWYDSQTDSLGAMEFYEPPDWNWNWDLSTFFQVLFWTVVAALVVALVVVGYRLARNREAEAAAATAASRDDLLNADQVEALPFLARRSRGDLLAQARHYYEQGNYAEAIIYLFSYELVQLDKFAVIRLAKGKTNRQYLRETARNAPVKGLLERTMLAFEGVFFGCRDLDRAGFEACWNALGEFEQHLRDVP